MFKKRDCVKTSKTNRNAQFYIGAAVGITVGLCVGKLLSSPAINKTDIPRELIANVSKDDNVSINKHKLNNVRSKSASRYEDKSVEDVALKTASSDSEININSSTPTKLQSDKMFSFRESCRITEKENVILSDSTFKLDEQDIESVDSTFERTNIDYLFDNVSGNVSNDTNKATCNTIVDMNLTSAQNDYDSFDIEYNEFGNLSLLSSTKVYCSIPF